MSILDHFKGKKKPPQIPLTPEQQCILIGNQVYGAIRTVLNNDPFKKADQFDSKAYLYGISMWLKVMAETCNLDVDEMCSNVHDAVCAHDPYAAKQMHRLPAREIPNAETPVKDSGEERPSDTEADADEGTSEPTDTLERPDEPVAEQSDEGEDREAGAGGDGDSGPDSGESDYREDGRSSAVNDDPKDI